MGKEKQMKTKLFVLIGLLMAAAPAFAHHGFAAEFDRTRPLKLKGTVVKWEVTNPHSWIQMDAKGDDGKVVTWMIEGGSPNNLYRLGFTKDSLPPGSEIVVDGYQAKDLSTRAVGKSVTFSDGRKLFLGLQALNSDPETKK
jgi:uncharacterized protein DUF6152